MIRKICWICLSSSQWIYREQLKVTLDWKNLRYVFTVSLKSRKRVWLLKRPKSGTAKIARAFDTENHTSKSESSNEVPTLTGNFDSGMLFLTMQLVQILRQISRSLHRQKTPKHLSTPVLPCLGVACKTHLGISSKSILSKIKIADLGKTKFWCVFDQIQKWGFQKQQTCTWKYFVSF